MILNCGILFLRYLHCHPPWPWLHIMTHEILGSIPMHLPYGDSKLSCDGIGKGIIPRDAISILPSAIGNNLLRLEMQTWVFIVQTLEDNLDEHEEPRPLIKMDTDRYCPALISFGHSESLLWRRRGRRKLERGVVHFSNRGQRRHCYWSWLSLIVLVRPTTICFLWRYLCGTLLQDPSWLHSIVLTFVFCHLAILRRCRSAVRATRSAFFAIICLLVQCYLALFSTVVVAIVIVHWKCFLLIALIAIYQWALLRINWEDC